MKKDLVDVANEIYRKLESGDPVMPNDVEHMRLKRALLFIDKPVKKKKAAKPVLTEEQETELPKRIEEYNDLFPKIKIPTSGKPARSSPRELIDAFRWFLLNNSQYTWDIILVATRTYVEQKKADDYNYMRTSQYFIRKQQPDKTWISDLANYCQQAIDNDEEPPTIQQTFEKVV